MIDEMMPLYPIFLDLCGRCCLVVGGGAVAWRKGTSLLAAGAILRMVAPTFCEEICQAATADPDRLLLQLRAYASEDVTGCVLIVAATDDEAVNRQVAADARAAGILVMVASDPAAGDFQVPATATVGPIQVAVSSGGGAPALAVALRDELGAHLDPWLGEFAATLLALRAQITTHFPEATRRRAFWYSITSLASRTRLRPLTGLPLRQAIEAALKE